MKRFLCFCLFAVLSACATPQAAGPSAVVDAPACTDGAEAWRGYLKAITNPGGADPKPLLDCAVARGHLEAMTAVGTDLTGASRGKADFEQGMSLLRAAAVAGQERAQRMLAFRYQAGKNWIGRNAYLALFWYGVANRDDPYYLAAPKTGGPLEVFRDHLSDQSKQALTQQIAAWRAGAPEPPNYTFDILITAMLRNRTSIAATAKTFNPDATLDYGLETGLPDAGLLSFFLQSSDYRAQVSDDVLEGILGKGSLLALMVRLRNLSAEGGREGEEAALNLQLFTRLGMDIRYLQPRHDTLLTRFSETRDLDQLIGAIAAASRPERQILATIATMSACSDGNAALCARSIDRLKPFITPPAFSFLIFVNAMAQCDTFAQQHACLLKNGGMGALRDIIVNDLVDFGGRSV